MTADGHHIEVWLNGVKPVDSVDEQDALSGAIAFRLWPGDGQKTAAWFKNVYINKTVRRVMS